jgi:hydrogenase maturation protease
MGSIEVLVIGVGNPLRGDDGAGLAAARRLRSRVQEEQPRTELDLAECTGDLTALLELWAGREHVLVFDAAPAVEPGRARRIDPERDPIPSHPARSTHALGLAQAVALGRALGSLPQRLALYAIGAAAFAHGEGLSRDAELGVEAAVAAAMQEVLAASRQEVDRA